jgi:hypothetical protein
MKMNKMVAGTPRMSRMLEYYILEHAQEPEVIDDQLEVCR